MGRQVKMEGVSQCWILSYTYKYAKYPNKISWYWPTDEWPRKPDPRKEPLQLQVAKGSKIYNGGVKTSEMVLGETASHMSESQTRALALIPTKTIKNGQKTLMLDTKLKLLKENTGKYFETEAQARTFWKELRCLGNHMKTDK